MILIVSISLRRLCSVPMVFNLGAAIEIRSPNWL